MSMYVLFEIVKNSEILIVVSKMMNWLMISLNLVRRKLWWWVLKWHVLELIKLLWTFKFWKLRFSKMASGTTLVALGINLRGLLSGWITSGAILSVSNVTCY